MKASRWEVGSEFHWTPLPKGGFQAWPARARWYLLARHALAALLSERQGAAVWLPAYFCHPVTEYWQRFATVRIYRDDPLRSQPEWATLRPRARDLVVAVNYFGVREPQPWYEWRRSHRCILVEDHSHDPLSPWALQSQADYAFASLRKTFPAPDGAILWSPRGRRLPAPPSGDAFLGSFCKLAAMTLKAGYLQGTAPAAVKPRYRELQRRGEEEFDRAAISPASPTGRSLLRRGAPSAWRRRRQQNAATLIARIDGMRAASPVFTSWPRGAAPLGVVLLFPSHAARDRMRARLEKNRIYCPVHWPATRLSPPAARRLAGALLTIPADQRYDAGDMARVARLLRQGS